MGNGTFIIQQVTFRGLDMLYNSLLLVSSLQVTEQALLLHKPDIPRSPLPLRPRQLDSKFP